MLRVACCLFLVLLWSGCGCDHGITADPFPIRVDTSQGPVIAHVSEDDGVVREAVIDMLSPLTVLDAPDDAPPSRRCADLTLYGDGPATAPDELVARAHLDLTVTALHACPDGERCKVGPEASPIEVGAIIGGDAFDPGAVRFDFSTGEMTIFPDIAGDSAARGRLCEAQINHPFRGGGTLFLGGSEVSFPARRITFGACLAFECVDPDNGAVVDRGADVQLVMSTAIGPTVLSETAYERWRLASGTGLPVSALPKGSVWLPSGPLEGSLGTIDRLAIVGRDDDNRGPCQQVYAHHLLSDHRCMEGESCPCSSGDSWCSVPAILELAPATPIEVLIVADDEPTLQALRAELRPDTAEIDGILGTQALASASVDIDPPNDRLLFRCETDGCQARPALITSAWKAEVRDCLRRTNFTCPGPAASP